MTTDQFTHEHWKDLNVRDKVQIGSAVALTLSGILMAFLSFFLNEYNIESGALLYISEAFLFAGAFTGSSIYFRSKFLEFESNADKRMKEYNENADSMLKK